MLRIYAPQEVQPPNDISYAFDKALARPGQLLRRHLLNVSALARIFGNKCDMGEIACIAGFFHDQGKISDLFQSMLEENIPHDSVRVPHSIFGAKRAFLDLAEQSHIAEIIGNAIQAHHGSLSDNLSPEGDAPLLEKLSSVPLFPNLPNSPDIDLEALEVELSAVISKVHDDDKAFAWSMIIKMIYSCLVDADRLDAYLHENELTHVEHFPDWDKMLANLMIRLSKFSAETEVEIFRKNVSDGCGATGLRERGVYKLEVPTGGGKTLASLRFALVHAQKHRLDRIIYVIPYLSILSQAAKEIREALDADEVTVLEHHSGFLPDETQFFKLQTDRWDAPIILTTQVQFLESIFSAKGSDLRKLHNVANSVIIFDEAQSLPIKCVHLFNSAINFLHSVGNTTILLCTATQPLLGDDIVKQKLRFSENPALCECGKLPARTKIVNKMQPAGYSYPEFADFVKEAHKDSRSILVIVNTKAAAKRLYEELKTIETPVLHLSTNMCAAHRDDVIEKLRHKLDSKSKEPVICISTQLIEAGVDISFECVIRDIAGLDSIYQAAGRCNRHGEFGEVKNVYVVNIAGQNLDRLKDIKEGAEIAKRLFDEGRDDDIDAFYQYYFHDRAGEMSYTIPSGGNIYDLLSHNQQGQQTYKNRGLKYPVPKMRSALKSAADAFYVIDKGRTEIIVPYGNATELISDYCQAYSPGKKREKLRQLARYSVSMYKYQIEGLDSAGALYPQDELIVLDAGFYNTVCGVDLDGKHEFLCL